MKSISARPMFQEPIPQAPKEKLINEEVSLLTGKTIIREHNNMTPFFGSNIRQNTENFTNDIVMSNYTGVSSTYKPKKESGPLFEPMSENIYGNTIVTDTVITPDRYEPSRFKSNVKPFKDQRFAAPIANTIDNNIRPGFKDVNELRVSNNPKISFKGDIIEGQRGSVRGIQGNIEKNRPKTFMKTGKIDNWFRGPGAYNANKSNEDYKVNFKDTQRKESLEYYGTTFSGDNQRAREYLSKDPTNPLQSRSEEAKKNNFNNDPIRTIKGIDSSNDYGKNSYNVSETERGDSQDVFSNVHRKESGMRTALPDSPKTTHRETVSDKHFIGNIKTSFDKNTLNTYDIGISENKVRVTTKEQLVENKYLSQATKNTGMGYVVNKYIAPTTQKEIDSSRSDYIGQADGISNNTSRDNYDNAEIRSIKEESLKIDRSSGPQKFQISGGKSATGNFKITDKMIFKEESTKRLLVKTSYPQTIMKKENLGVVGKQGEEIENSRLNPELIQEQIQENPYALKPHYQLD